MLKNVFGFSEHQEKATYGLGFQVTLSRKKDDAALQKTVAFDDAMSKIDYFQWYVPHYTPSFQQQGLLSKQIFSETPKELRHTQRSVFMKDVNIQILWNFEASSQKNTIVPIWILIRFQQSDRKDSQNFNNDAFSRLLVTSAHRIVGSGKYPQAGFLINYDGDDYS